MVFLLLLVLQRRQKLAHATPMLQPLVEFEDERIA